VATIFVSRAFCVLSVVNIPCGDVTLVVALIVPAPRLVVVIEVALSVDVFKDAVLTAFVLIVDAKKLPVDILFVLILLTVIVEARIVEKMPKGAWTSPSG
jgi:hypothetical protein